MGKVILTESQYQRLKKRLINNMINEADEDYVALSTASGAGMGWAVGGPVGAIPGALIGAAFGLLSGSGGSYDGVSKIFAACRASGVGKTTMGGGSLDSIASQIRNAIEGWGTNEEAIKSALSKVQTIPDLCAVSQRYAENYPGSTLLGDLDGDIDDDAEWNEYVYLPLLAAKRKSEELGKKSQAAGGGGSGSAVKAIGDSIKRTVNRITSDKLWYNFPCVPLEPNSKGSQMSNGSTVFVIGREVFYNNGRMKKEDNTMTDYHCDANNKIVRYKRKPTGGGGGTPTPPTPVPAPKPAPKPVPKPVVKPKVKTAQKAVSKPSIPVAPSPIDYGLGLK